ncbi:DnaB-like helicase C-terminal domain-containing protein [Enterococcus dongliensis]|uniref:DnaB-like helicase C-terminal domain-containing protein n=1 Tax=Enterococcus dongliensis TaxID=2559925 RepID=UPI00288FCF79|nr:DnaB-like helicase C-terminal domain-containing protein [Enterococcus dongliensis]MDT2675230.1 DnaB-like helicase C-terminal domain-containing protein [Enterococcus dongliensis]
MNNELSLVAEMLNNPSIITSIDIDSEWFESPQQKMIVEALTRLRGMNYTTEQVYREMRSIDLFSAGTVDDLETLKGLAPQLGIERELARQIHNAYLDRKLHTASTDYAQTLSKTDGDKLQRLLEEKREVNHIKSDGRLDVAFAEFCDSLDRPSNAMTTYKPLDDFLGGGITGGKLIVLAGRPATGKGHPNWLEIPTPKGKVRFGDLKPNDYVFDQHGKPTRVVGVYPRGTLKTFEVTLKDGRKTIVDEDHIWSVYTSKGNLKEITTKEIFETGTHRVDVNEKKHARYSIPLNGPVEYKPQNKSVVDPYLIGVFLGDGCSSERPLTISGCDEFVFKKVAETTNTKPKKLSLKNYSWVFELKEYKKNKKYLQTKDVFSDLPEVTRYSHLKEIPEYLMTSSISERLELLRGLFDTDGSAYISKNSPYVKYNTTSRKMAYQVRELLFSVGYENRIRKDERGKNICYEISVLAEVCKLSELFKTPTKKNVLLECNHKFRKKFNRSIISGIKEVGYEEVTCISVENKDQLYLCNDFIVTHNTAFALNIMYELFTKNNDVACDFFTFEMGQNELMTRLVSKVTNINSLLFVGKDKLSPDNKVKAREAYEAMKRSFDMRVFTSEYSNLNDIKYAIKKRIGDKRYVAFVDYAGLITVNDTRKNERQVMNEVTRELKKLTTDYGITIILLAQLSRAVEQRENKRPMLSDLKESGSLEQDANVTLLLSADEKDSRKIRCDVAKNREGMTGIAPFIFDKKHMDFSIDFDEWRG